MFISIEALNTNSEYRWCRINYHAARLQNLPYLWNRCCCIIFRPLPIAWWNFLKQLFCGWHKPKYFKFVNYDPSTCKPCSVVVYLVFLQLGLQLFQSFFALKIWSRLKLKLTKSTVALPLLAYARVRYDKETTKWSGCLWIITKLSETAVDYFTVKRP